MMWRLLIPLVFRLALALPPSWNGTVTACPHDALYTSLVEDGGGFCSSVLEAAHCGGGYSTPSEFVSVNQTRIASYCGCLLTSSNVTGKPTASEVWSVGDPVTATRDSASQTVESTSTEASESPVGRPGPSVSSASSTVASGRSSFSTNGEATATSRLSSSPGTGTATNLSSSIQSLTSGSFGNVSITAAVRGSSTEEETFTSTAGANNATSQSPSVTAVSEASGTRGFSSSGLTSTGSQSPASSSGFSNATVSSAGQTSGPVVANSTRASSVFETSRLRSTSSGSGISVPESSSNGTALTSATGASPAASGWNSSTVISGTLAGSMTAPSSTGTSNGETMTGLPRPGGNSTSLSLTNPVSAGGSRVESRTASQESGAESGAGTPTPSRNSTSVISRSSSSRLLSTTGTGTTAAVTRADDTSPASGSGSTGSVPATATPTFITPTPFPNATSSQAANETSQRPSEISAANFTRVTRTAAVSRETCYTLARDPEGDSTWRALLHNSKLREENVSIPVPYIESVDFESGGVDPLYVTVRDINQGSHFIDISNKSQIAIVDSSGNSMLLDTYGIHFSANSCHYGVSITMDSMYRQLADLAGVECSTNGLKKRMENLDFAQILNLHDQCGDPVDKTLRQYPQLMVGDTSCVNTEVDEAIGEWLFDCTFPGSQSGSMRCQAAIRSKVVDFLLVDPFGGACPDLSTVITTLAATGQDIINSDSLRAELYNQGLNTTESVEAETAVEQYAQLWDVLQQSLSKSQTQSPSNSSALEEHIDLYNTHRSLEDDICEDLHAGEIPLKLSLTAGTTSIDAITTLNWAPESPRPYNITIQDSSKIACCSNGTTATGEDDNGGDTCAYPASAIIADTGCICGTTAGGASLAFEETECANYVSECDADADCSDFPGFVCLIGSCCGGGVCVDPYACSQAGTTLVKF